MGCSPKCNGCVKLSDVNKILQLAHLTSPHYHTKTQPKVHPRRPCVPTSSVSAAMTEAAGAVRQGKPIKSMLLGVIGCLSIGVGALFAPTLLPGHFKSVQQLHDHPTLKRVVRAREPPRRAVDTTDTTSVDHKSENTGGSDVVQLWSSRCEVLARSNRHDAACNLTGGRFVKEAAAPCLLTGLGRSGTLFTSHLLHSLGWEINHDNHEDFCPCPGKDGSVAHSYAFAATRRCCYPPAFVY